MYITKTFKIGKNNNFILIKYEPYDSMYTVES